MNSKYLRLLQLLKEKIQSYLDHFLYTSHFFMTSNKKVDSIKLDYLSKFDQLVPI